MHRKCNVCYDEYVVNKFKKGTSQIFSVKLFLLFDWSKTFYVARLWMKSNFDCTPVTDLSFKMNRFS